MVSQETSFAIQPKERALFVFLTLAMFAVHFFLVTRNWNSGQLSGHEFRQSQTGLTTLFIQRENNFSLAYPTPVLGKPWCIPMEFPLYQWTVAKISSVTNMPLAEAARLVTLGCFYLTLPALFLLLGQLGLPSSHRLVGLCTVLTSPVYIFYSRAFLIESMALLSAIWFAVAFVQTMRTFRFAWLVTATSFGVLAALVKVTTFLIWLAPIAAYGIYCLYQTGQQNPGNWAPAWRTLRWGVCTVALPFGAAIWWVDYADLIKAENPAGLFLTSSEMKSFNFGTWPMRWDRDTWRGFLQNWDHSIMPLAVMAVVVAVIFLIRGRSRWLGSGAVCVFLLPHLVFPRLFSWHDYYFYANAVFWIIAVTFAINGVFLSRWRKLGWPLLLAALASQLVAYQVTFYTSQRQLSNGGSHLTDVLREMLPQNSVLVISGDDWSSIIPYYAQKRALMIRSEHERDWPMIDQSFKNLAKEDVAALILIGKERDNSALLHRAAEAFNIDPVPGFTYQETTVYLSTYHRSNIIHRLEGAHPFTGVTVAAQPKSATTTSSAASTTQLKPVPESLWETIFKNISPKPSYYEFAQNLSTTPLDGIEVIGAHPDANLWITPPPQASEIIWEFGIHQAAYEKEGDRTDGVDFIIVEKTPDSIEREIFRRTLDPLNSPLDRGAQSTKVSYHPTPGSHLLFMTRPHKTYSYDWAYWRKIQIN